MNGLSAPTTWTEKAQRTLNEVRAAIARGEKPDFKSHWTDDDVREPLLALVGRKCWYCETTIQRADVHVDHFRPKSEVSGVVGHPGYWWLAYKLANYRIACKHCNSSGARFNDVPEGRAKGSRFPLLAGLRAWQPLDRLSLEQPLLLDPTQPGDPELIGFDPSGYAHRSADAPYSATEEASGLCRADETIRILALNATELIEKRHELMEEIKELGEIPGLPSVAARIAKKVGPQAQWSAAALAALTLQRACTLPLPQPNQPTAAAASQPTITPTRSKVDLLDLIVHLDPVELASGIPLTGRHANELCHALLKRDGRISVLGRPWGTPTTAARVATGSDGIDGWDFWRLTVGGVEQSLAQLRASHSAPGA
ncbi:HNH endonuclease [Kitasatospora sp. McL0602]|uniref:HNH endonuclease n=1 Tax=Kitasatospora sp. McL0602 TaxID=3439530 RepID=UPI003F89DB39